ncbi:MAG: hypothetical protein IJ594_06735 [Oscillospiraceae bacterium]|nr:hypothetical protein [Oscillospiraceae bacterium]
MNYYIASCVFTSQFPALSARIQDYVRERFGYEIVRCCVGRYKLKEFEDRMPAGELRERWAALPDCGDFQPGDHVWSLCHNCNNIIEETRPGVRVHSLWELLDADEAFPLPTYEGLRVTVQDCWRARERAGEQAAVRSLLGKMKIAYVEAPENHERTEFCGVSLYRPQPARNPKLAPKHYVDGAAGKFLPHTEEEQDRLMRSYCAQLETETVVCCCHYCLEGLKRGGADGRHIAQLLFP